MLLRMKSKAIVLLVLALVLAFNLPLRATAAVQAPEPAAKISFTFDDGFTSNYTQAAPTLAKYGLTGTSYVTTGCVGMTKAPNKCRADSDATYMTWTQIKDLKSKYGWEIGSHTATHPYLATFDASDGQPNKLTPTQVTNELVNSKAALAAQGINATSFASPYGDYNMPVLAEIAKSYSSQRGFQDFGMNQWPNSDYLLRVKPVQEGVTVANVKTAIDQAITSKQWLVLVMHDIKTNPSTDPDNYQYATSKLDQIAAYVKSKQASSLIKSVNVSQGLVTSDVNLLTNGSFNSGISSGWTTNNTSQVVKDTAKNGSYPDPINSIKFTASTTPLHLFSPQVSVNSRTTYMLKSFLNVQKLTSGEVTFYIDEYDANGNWISGQYKKGEGSVFVESMNFTYTPTSAAVSKASLQIAVSANSGITAFVDNVQWFPLQTIAISNLITNGDFWQGIAAGWTTDNSTAITADANNNGGPATPVRSAKLTSATQNSHLFSSVVNVVSTKQYNIDSYLNLKQISSDEIAYYIDEYDVNGNWISGQLKAGVSTVGAGNVGFTYTPSSVNVAKARLQIIVKGNAGILAYLDDVYWY